jgi:hypothetical protein
MEKFYSNSRNEHDGYNYSTPSGYSSQTNNSKLGQAQPVQSHDFNDEPAAEKKLNIGYWVGGVLLGGIIWLSWKDNLKEGSWWWERLSDGINNFGIWHPKKLTSKQLSGVVGAINANPSILLPYRILHPQFYDVENDRI